MRARGFAVSKASLTRRASRVGLSRERERRTAASSRRRRSLCRSLTQLAFGALDFERKVERSLVLQRALCRRQAQVVADEPEIDPGTFGSFKDVGVIHGARIRPPHAFRSTAIGDVRAIRNVPIQPEIATRTAAATISSSSGPTGGQ